MARAAVEEVRKRDRSGQPRVDMIEALIEALAPGHPVTAGIMGILAARDRNQPGPSAADCRLGRLEWAYVMKD